MRFYRQSKSSASEASPPESTSAGDDEVPTRRSGGVFTSRIGLGNWIRRSHRDGQGEGEEVGGGLECTSYTAMEDNESRQQRELTAGASNAHDECKISFEDRKEQEEVGLKYIAPDAAIEDANGDQRQEQTQVAPTAHEDDEVSSNKVTRLSKVKHFKRAVTSVLPKVEPLPWTTFFCLSFWCTIPAALYILLFTQMGFGESFYYALSTRFGGYANVFAGTLAISGFFFYMFDIDEWTTSIGNIFRFISVAAIFSFFVITVVLTSNEHPYGLISLFSLFNPLWFMMVKLIFYREFNARTFVSGLSGPLLLVSLLTLAAFVVWIFLDHDNEWNEVTKVEAAVRTGCEPNFTDHPNCVSEDGSGATCFYVDYSSAPQTLIFPENCERMCLNVYSACSNGFILWCGPVLIGLSLLFHSFSCTFLRTAGTSKEKDIVNFGKLWMFVLTVIWASASLSGAGAGVSTSLMSITAASLLGSAVFISASYSHDELKHNRKSVLARIHAKYGDSLDVVRGLFVVTCSPIVAAYFILSALNQSVRKLGISPSPSCEMDVSDRHSGVITAIAKKQLIQMRSWDRAKVFTYAIYWGIAFMIMQVLVANLTVVLLSWIIEKTASFGLASVTGIMIAVGMIMFLFPPVPGMPVYLALGIVLPARGHGFMGWTWSVLYSSGIGLLLKLSSSALQQVIFGENLSRHVKVRQFVGINSNIMKAMRLVVGKAGLSVPKVAILMGGPDWPTSVLCGIMRLSVLQIMIGTLPTIVLIIPSCLTGTFLYMASLTTDSGSLEFPWASTVSTITASVTALVQFGSMIVAGFYLEQAADKRGDEIAEIADDEEVKEADEKDEHMRKCYKNVTQWNGALPITPKLILICSLASITASCFLVQLFPSMCFVDHTLTDSIDENLGGNVANLFLPMGLVAVGLFIGSMILLGMFMSWGKRQAKLLAESGTMIPNDSLA